MRTLILNGSPRTAGDTAALVRALRERLQGEVLEVNCYRARITPCVDCRKCAEEFGCAIQDGMGEITPFLEVCENVVIATPVYFSQPTPPLLAVCSRLQPYFYAKVFRKEPSRILPKRGGILMAGGGSGSAEPAIATCRALLRSMGAKEIAPPACSLRTDSVPAKDDAAALAQAAGLADFLNATARTSTE